MTLDSSGPTSRIYFSQRLRLHYVDWGNPEAPPAAARSWRAGSLPQLGLGRDALAPRLARAGARSARSRRQPMVARRQLHDRRLCLRPRPADPSAGIGAGHHHRPFARRHHRAALCRHLSRSGPQTRRDRRAWGVAATYSRAPAAPHRRADAEWIDEQRGCPAACRAAMPRSRTPLHACRKPTAICRRSRRGT